MDKAKSKSECVVLDHKVGKIHDVSIKDFMTYKEVVYKPFEHLNILTGPNGSGKSSIVAAIMLGLGGSAKLIDSGTQVGDYVKKGKSVAEVTVRLIGREANSFESFRRIISQNGTSKFFHNDKNVSMKKYQEIVTSYNIQVDNLCQFLPQHRLQDFSRMNAAQLLQSTLSSVANEDLLNTFNLLKEYRKNFLNAETKLEEMNKNLLQADTRLKQLHVVATNCKKHREMKDDLYLYQLKRMWEEIKLEKVKLIDMQKDIEDKKKKYEDVHDQYIDYKKAIEKRLKVKAGLDNDVEKKTQLVKNTLKSQQELYTNLDALREKLIINKNKKKKQKDYVAKSESEINNLENLLKTQKSELKNLEKIQPELDVELKEYKHNLDAQQNSLITKVQFLYEKENSQNENLLSESIVLNTKITKMANKRDEKIKFLRNKEPNLVRALEWIDKNRSRFKSRIYDPMILELYVRSKEHAKYIENCVKYRDLIAIPCESTEDMSQLIDILNTNMKLNVNIIHTPAADKCTFQPTTPLSSLTELGFHSYLTDIIYGPPNLINRLCVSYGIHNIAIGRQELMDETPDLPPHIRLFFAGDRRLQIIVSRYGGGISSTESKIYDKNLLIVNDPREMQALKKREAEIKSQLESLKDYCITIKEEISKDKENLNQLKMQYAQKEKKMSYIHSLKEEVLTTDKKLNKLKELVRSYSKIDTQHDLELKQIVASIDDTLNRLCINTDKIQKSSMDKDVARCKENYFDLEMNMKVHELKKFEEEHKRIFSIIYKQKNAIDLKKKEIDRSIEKVKVISKGKTPDDKDFPFRSKFKKMNSLTLEDLIRSIHDFEARLECMKVDDSSIEQYELQSQKVDDLKEEMEKLVNESERVDNEIKQKHTQWVNDLENLISQISKKFTHFMTSMEYVGEITLIKTDEFNYDTYGIGIWVQYRSHAKLQLLDVHTQSGGERAVAIAIYSLSMQHLTNAPFRIVDEINQGMDASNERKIFNLLLEVAGKPGASQYIFVTPKIQRHCNYNDFLCVSVVFNSQSIEPGVFDKSEKMCWDWMKNQHKD